MAIIILASVLIAVVIFVAILLATKPTSEQKALAKRITHIKAAPGQVSGDIGGLLLASNDDGSFAWMEGIAARFRVSEKLQTLIIQSDTDISLGKLLFFSVGSGGIVFTVAALYFSKLYIAAILGFVCLFIPIMVLRFRKGRRLKAFNGGLADSIDMMSRSLRAGHSLVAAIGIVAEQAVEPLKSEFGEVFKKQNYGLPIREALMQLLDRVPSQDLRVLVTGMLVQRETGGNLAEILDRISHVIRERVRIQGELNTHTAQGRLTGWILCLLPIVMLGLINWINPGYSNVLFSTPVGNKLLATGVFLLVLGGLIIRQIINSIEV